MIRNRLLAAALLLPLATDSALADGESDPQAADRDAIAAQVAAYTAAFNAGDAKALAACWSVTGEWCDHESGERITGRDAILERFKAMFAEGQDLQLEVAVDSIRFVTRQVAIEEGTAMVIDAAGPMPTTYTAVHVKSDEGWRLDSVRETSAGDNAVPSSGGPLDELAWMVGEWTDDGEGSSIQTTCQFTKNSNFLTRTFKVVIDGAIDLEGTQVIGRDPRNGQLRSWVFDSDGGFGEGRWFRRGVGWEVRVTHTLADGAEALATNLFTPIDDDQFEWSSVDRRYGGKRVPDIEPVVVRRQAAE